MDIYTIKVTPGTGQSHQDNFQSMGYRIVASVSGMLEGLVQDPWDMILKLSPVHGSSNSSVGTDICGDWTVARRMEIQNKSLTSGQSVY